MILAFKITPELTCRKLMPIRLRKPTRAFDMYAWNHNRPYASTATTNMNRNTATISSPNRITQCVGKTSGGRLRQKLRPECIHDRCDLVIR